MKVTTLKPAEAPNPGVKTPKEWDLLCRKALLKAESTQDRRAEGLRKALEMGRQQKVLQTLGIVCEADLIREFGGSAH